MRDFHLLLAGDRRLPFALDGRELDEELWESEDARWQHQDPVHLVLLRARREQQQLRLGRVHAPRDWQRDRLDELEHGSLWDDAVALDAACGNDEKIAQGRRRPVEAQDPPSATLAAVAHVREPRALEEVDEFELGIRALDGGEGVVEREANLLHLAAILAPDRRPLPLLVRPTQWQRHELAVLDEDQPARRLVETELRVLLLEVETCTEEHVGAALRRSGSHPNRSGDRRARRRRAGLVVRWQFFPRLKKISSFSKKKWGGFYEIALC